MKIFSVCKFVGIEEDDMLLRIKIENEKYLVDNWILLMNKRRWNGDLVENASYERIITRKFYDEYRHRIVCIQLEVSPWDQNYPIWDEGLKTFCKHGDQKSNYFYYKNQLIACDSKENRRNIERFMLSAARHHSSYAYNYLESKAKDHDIVLISDLDESIDTSINCKKELILNFLKNLSKQQSGGRILRHKFQYDYMNSWPTESYIPSQEKGTRWIHAIPWKLIRSYGRYAFQDFRSYDFGNNLLSKDFSLAFEYTLCCSIEELKNKFKYNGHANGVSMLDIITALKLNKMCIDSSNLKHRSALLKIKNSMNFTIMNKIDEKRSSAFVLNNLINIKTDNVSSDYHENRIKFDRFINLTCPSV